MHIHSTAEAFEAFLARGIAGEVSMLNLLRFAETADYSASPELAPEGAITGAAAYETYRQHAGRLVQEVGGELIYEATGGPALIGPPDEFWDLVLIVRYPCVERFGRMVSSDDYQAIAGHRTAALSDSRLVPLTSRGPGRRVS